jgi:hypothetical protein
MREKKLIQAFRYVKLTLFTKFLLLFHYYDVKRTKKIDIDLLMRKNFAAGVTRGKNELKLNDPSQTQVTGLIENAVIEVNIYFKY